MWNRCPAPGWAPQPVRPPLLLATAHSETPRWSSFLRRLWLRWAPCCPLGLCTLCQPLHPLYIVAVKCTAYRVRLPVLLVLCVERPQLEHAVKVYTSLVHSGCDHFNYAKTGGPSLLWRRISASIAARNPWFPYRPWTYWQNEVEKVMRPTTKVRGPLLYLPGSLCGSPEPPCVGWR